MNEADLDDSIVVDIITWVLYIGWLSVLAGVALWVGIEPMPTIVDAFAVQWQGQVAALATGVVFILGSRMLYERLRARYAESSDAP